MRRPLLLLPLLLFYNLYSFAQIIPSGRTANWQISGYSDSIPDPQHVVSVMNFGAVANGISDDFNAVNSAIQSLAGNRGVVYFPPGEYLIASSLNLPDSVILRGAGSDSTWLKFDLQGIALNCINITGSITSVFDTISKAAFGSDTIHLNNTALYSAGDFIELLQDNGSWDTQPVSWADRSVGQILRVKDVIPGIGLITENYLRYDYHSLSGLFPRVRKIVPRHEVGIECLQISREDNAPSGVAFNINFSFANRCWVRGIESSRSVGSHIYIDASSGIHVSGNYIHHAFAYDGVSTHGYGVTLFNHAGECRIENNIMRFLRHSFSLQAGANGNVISYNYSTEPNRSEVPANFGADISMHGHYPFLNLFEGNIVQNIQLDQTWGPSGPYNTFFRNRAELYGILMTSGTVESDSQHFVGNDVNNLGIVFGNYVIAGTNHIQHGNMVRGTITPAGTGIVNDTSYYLSSPPDFWTPGMIWPSIGLPNPTGNGSIPARDRYLNAGTKTVCRADFNTVISIASSLQDYIVYPNPAFNEITIRIPVSIRNAHHVSIHSLNGKQLCYESIIPENGIIRLSNLKNLTPGFYILTLNAKNFSNRFKVMIAESE
ncbi:MAG: T9SS C-terminal target domain-containing protein [Bacteroidetes bacterium]|nr:MAG: T9SS C-terminal target domain-containing protein [Bacteroidota bacterium]